MVRPLTVSHVICLAALLAVAGAARAATPQDAPPEQTLTAEVIDPAAFLKDGLHGPEQADHTYESVDGGQTLALLETATATLYLLLADNPGDDPNALVYDYVNQLVRATGRIYARGGVSGIVLTGVEPVEPADAAGAVPVIP